MAREGLAIVGAAVGYAVGGPTGAQVGFSLGYAVGGAIDPVKVRAPGLSEAPIQTSRDGVPITLFWGLQAGSGNIIQKNQETQQDFTTSQGKGGGSETTETRRFRTFAIGVGYTTFGPIAEITRIWENNRLVYDTRAAPAIPAEETAAYAEGITIYLGDETQLPDPELESEWGADDTPAYRGLAYVVWNNKDLTDFGGSIPQFRFEVNGSRDLSITSKPYPADAVDGLIATVAFPSTWLVQWPIEAIEQTSLPLGIEYGDTLIPWYRTEAIEQTSIPVGIAYGDTLIETFCEEAFEQTSNPVEITYGDTLVEYRYEEAFEQTVEPLSIVIT